MKKEEAIVWQTIASFITLIGIIIEFSIPGVEDFLPSIVGMPTTSLDTLEKKIMSIVIIWIIGEIVGAITSLVFSILKSSLSFRRFSY